MATAGLVFVKALGMGREDELGKMVFFAHIKVGYKLESQRPSNIWVQPGAATSAGALATFVLSLVVHDSMTWGYR